MNTPHQPDHQDGTHWLWIRSPQGITPIPQMIPIKGRSRAQHIYVSKFSSSYESRDEGSVVKFAVILSFVWVLIAVSVMAVLSHQDRFSIHLDPWPGEVRSDQDHQRVQDVQHNVQIVDLIQKQSESLRTKPDESVPILSYQDHQTAAQEVIDLKDISKQGRGTQLKKESSSALPLSPSSAFSSDELDHADDQAMNSTALKNNPLSSSYDAFLSSSQDLIAQAVRDNPAAVLSEDIPRGSALSLNTTSYYHMGYFMKMRDQIESVWSFPASARYLGIFGDVKVRFDIKKSGHLMDVKIVKSSGHDILDQEVIQTLYLAAPFDPLPSSWSEQVLEITGVFSYVLR